VACHPPFKYFFAAKSMPCDSGHREGVKGEQVGGGAACLVLSIVAGTGHPYPFSAPYRPHFLDNLSSYLLHHEKYDMLPISLFISI
jgi:hypothetical protein